MKNLIKCIRTLASPILKEYKFLTSAGANAHTLGEFKLFES